MERISLKNGFEAYRNLMALISGGSPSYATETKSFTRLAARDLGFQL